MPEELWAEAIVLARKYGVHPVSKNATVSYTRLKKLVDMKRSTSVLPRFVEVSPSRAIGGPHIEIDRPDGCRLTVRDADAQTVASLTSAFLGTPR